MRILHICLGAFFIDNYSYQENMLTKYHSKMGHEVSVITSLFSFDCTGSGYYIDKPSCYLNNDNVRVFRLAYKQVPLAKKLRLYDGLLETIKKIKPDIIFIHNCQFLDVKYVVEYKKNNPNVRIFVDNHADFLNSARNWLSKNILHKIIWKHCAKLIEPYAEKFWGVLPARVDFLVDVYGVSKNKVELLVMGADDEKVDEARNGSSREEIRQKYGIAKNDFLIMTGGKVDDNKLQILMLMEAVKKIHRQDVKLIVFGAVLKDIKPKFESLLCDSVKYIGWVESEEAYRYFNASDLVVFPGLHSVFWEQVVGLGKPCVFRYMKGFTHIDLGGNCMFLREDSADEIENVLLTIINNSEVYENMKKVAITVGYEKFSFKKIANYSILNS